MRQCLVKFVRLSSADRWLAMRALMALVIARMALAILRFAHKAMPLDAARRLVALSERLLPAPMPNAPVEHIAWAVKAAGESVPGFGNCLVRAVALEALLKVAHHACELRIGVAKTASGEFLAHAWIEKEGKVLVGEFKPGSFHPLTVPVHTL
jgi:Transglutaminase-like superfamily